MTIGLISDIRGNLENVVVVYSKSLGIIPISVIEDFEQAVLRSDIKLIFDAKRLEFKDSEWVGTNVTYTSKWLMGANE